MQNIPGVSSIEPTRTVSQLEAQVGKLNGFIHQFENLVTVKTAPSTTFMQDIQEVTTSIWGFFATESVSAPIETKKLEAVEVNQQNIEKLFSHNKKLNQIHIQILNLKKEVAENSDREMNPVYAAKLQKATEEFEKEYLSFVTSKSGVLSDIMTKLGQFKAGHGVDSTEAEKFSALEKEIQDDLHATQTTIVEMNSRIEDIKQHLQQTQLELEQAYVSKHAQIEADLIEKTSQVGSLVDELVKQPSTQEQREALADIYTSLVQELSRYKRKVKELRAAILEIDSSASKKETESKCQFLSLECLSIQQVFEEKRAELIAEKQQFLKESAAQMSVKDVSRYAASLSREMTGVIQNLKTINQTVRALRNSYAEDQSQLSFALFDPIASFREVETWSSTAWGALLSQPKGMSDYLGVGFQRSVDSLKAQRREVKQQIRIAEGTKGVELVGKLNALNRVLYHTLLQRIIEVVGEKQRVLKKEGDKLTPQEKALLEIEVQVLNAKFEGLIGKFEQVSTSTAQRSLVAAASQTTLEVLKSIASFGYFQPHLTSVGELKQRKRYADLGYNMLADVKEWFNTLKPKENESIADCLKREVMAFLVWADKHPRTAIALSSDMALTCAVIGGQSYMDQFMTTMRAKAYTTAFMEGWGQLEEEPVETQEELKYRALADLAHYAPMVTAAVKAVTTSGLNPQQILLNTAVDVLKAAFVQQAREFIPEEYATAALQALTIIRGEGFQRVLEQQRNLELVRIGGAAKQLLIDPSGFISHLKMKARVWFQTIQQAKGAEKVYRIATQIVLPGVVIGSAVGGAYLFGSVVLIPLTFAAAGVFLAIRKVNQVFDQVYSTKSKVLEFMQKHKKEEAEQAIEQQIQVEQTRFIADLRERQVLPPVFAPKASLQLSPAQEAAYQEIKQAKVRELAAQLSQELATKGGRQEESSVDYIQVFQQLTTERLQGLVVDAVERSTALQSVEEAERQRVQTFLVNEIRETLVTQWLSPHIKHVFAERALAFGQKGISEADVKPQDPSAFLAGELKRVQASHVAQDLSAGLVAGVTA
jgi:hypothetical protein